MIPSEKLCASKGYEISSRVPARVFSISQTFATGKRSFSKNVGKDSIVMHLHWRACKEQLIRLIYNFFLEYEGN